jgi:hypothetical protein
MLKTWTIPQLTVQTAEKSSVESWTGVYILRNTPPPRGKEQSADVIWGKKYEKWKRKGGKCKRKREKGEIKRKKEDRKREKEK